MPKKKNKNRSSSESHGTWSPEAKSEKNTGTGFDKEKNQTSFVELTLTKGAVDKSTSSNANGNSNLNGSILGGWNKHGRHKLQFTPSVLLNEDDARKICVRNGADVVVLSLTPDEKLQGAAIAKVHVASPHRSSPSRGTYGSPVSAGSQKKLKEGTCHILPFSLSLQLCGKLASDESEPAPSSSPRSVPMTPLRQNPPPTPSSSKSKFSFARGGGGDSIIASPMSDGLVPSQEQNRSSGGVSVKLFVVPLKSSFGQNIKNKICRVAKDIVVEEDGGAFASCNALAKRLILAHIEGAYIPEGVKISISLAGKQIQSKLTKVQCSSRIDEEDLSQRLEDVSINDDSAFIGTEEKLVKAINAAMNIQAQAKLPILYLVTNQTQISMMGKDVQTTTESCAPAKKQYIVAAEDVVARVKSLLLSPILQRHIYPNSIGPPKGVLLHGPSGTGKSSLAKELSQTLLDHAYVQYIECVSLQSLTAIAGQAEEHLARIFQAAREGQSGKEGSIIIMDDIHLICPQRRGLNIASDRVAATLLALMDGITSSSTKSQSQAVTVLAITSNPSSLDSALRRAGRLDTEIEMPLPDEPASRAKILKFQLESHNMPDHFTNEQWMILGRRAKGFSGADCTLAIKDAIRHAVLRSDTGGNRGNTIVKMEDMEGSLRGIKPSAIKAIEIQIPRVPWSSIGGMVSVKKQLQEAVEMTISQAEMFEKLRIRAPRGILLYGPPGCSKTLMARALATESQMNFLAVKGPELLSKWLGESERALASLFRRARLASPSIIFFDEIDAIATRRGSAGSSGGERLLSQLLTEMDGVQTGKSNLKGKQQRVVVVCATNRPDLLDSALMRPGRIDKMIYVGIPDADSRSGIFKLSLEGRSISDDINVELLATDQVSGGLSGAEVVASCRNAALLALEESISDPSAEPVICMRHMLKAIRETDRQITSDMLKFYADYQTKEAKLTC